MSTKTKKYSRKQNGDSSRNRPWNFARQPVVGVPFKTAHKGLVDAMRTIINSAGLLKATGTKVFTNKHGRLRTSYNPVAIKNILRTKGHNTNVINHIAKLVSDKGIAATAQQLGIQGYNRNFAKENATQIRRIHNPNYALMNARVRAKAAMESLGKKIQS